MDRFVEFWHDLQQVKNLVYMPVPGDLVDRRLADYINTRGKRFTFSKFLFLREAKGVYSYLKKRVFIQL